ncbi:tetratricopeptide repeat-containing sulfotransferase family protein [Kordiimonas aestuarii]|uniref:tetratricopeptide repeat-containing sulfotransferase family protein n=1 Tax=Kordiimonas aestuarii TaxID=1005925 RepID=UPI0021D063B2|nr:tetratricopeptide repeat-containing sulfotransferase family protein [Kordiimonas aestuarii]
MDKQAFYRQAAALVQAQAFADAEARLAEFLCAHPDDEIARSIYGSALMRQDKIPEALEVFVENTRRHPSSWAALADLGFAAMKAGDADHALASFEEVVARNPDFYLAWCNLERLYFDRQDYKAAVRASDRAETCDPLDGAYRDIRQLMQSDRRADAEKIARQMLQQQSGHPRASFFLAHLADTVGAHEARRDILRASIEQHPANVMLRRSLVEALEAMGAYTAALAEARALTDIKPDFTAFWLLSRICGHVADYEGALKAAEAAAAFLEEGSTELGKVDLLRGHALKILGRRRECEEAYRACTVNTPDNGAGWWGLADLKDYHFSSGDKEAMAALAGNDGLPDAQRCQAAFALARACENDQKPGEAIGWYKTANALRTDAAYDPLQHADFYRRLKESFSVGCLERRAPREMLKGPTPIFVVGMPRAGSTLIEQMLASHSRIDGTMELQALAHLERRIRIEGGRRFGKQFPESIADFSAEDLCRFGQAYLDETAIYRAGGDFFIDKMPPNFERIGLIHKILPHAIIIDARRYPVDCGYSAFKQHFAGGHDYSYDLGHIGHYYNCYLDLMDYWQLVLPDGIMTVQYEDTINDTEAVVQAMLAHVGVAFEGACLEFYRNRRAVKTASSEQVRQPINRKGVGAWTTIAEEIHPLFDSLGDATLKRFAAYAPDGAR